MTISIPPGGRRGSTGVVLDALADVLEPPDIVEPDSDSDPEAPVVALLLPSVEDSADPESVGSGPSVMVVVAASDSVEEGSADSDDSGGDDVADGASNHFEY